MRQGHSNQKVPSALALTAAVMVATSLVAGCASSQSAQTENVSSSVELKAGSSRSQLTGAPIRTSSSWPKVSIHQVGTLPLGVVGNSLALGPAGRLVSVAGYTGVVSTTDVVQVLPTAARLASMPVPTHDTAAGYLGRSLYVIGGGQSVSYNTVVEVQGKSASTVANLSRPLSDAVAVPYTWHRETGLLLIGGYDGQVFRTDVTFIHLVKGQRIWTKLFTMPVGLRYAAVAVSGDKVYIAGGKQENGIASNAIYEWKGTGASAIRVATLASSVEKAAVFSAPPYLVLAGGMNRAGVPTDKVVAIDTRNGKEKVIARLATPLADFGSAQSGDDGYIAGGMKSTQETDTSRIVWRLRFSR